MARMEGKMIAPSVVPTIHKKEIMVIQGRMENKKLGDDAKYYPRRHGQPGEPGRDWKRCCTCIGNATNS